MGRKSKRKSSATSAARASVNTEPAKEAKSQSPQSEMNEIKSSHSSDSSMATSTQSTTTGIRKKSAKLAAKRAKVLSYEAALAPKPNPVKGQQVGAVPTRSVGEVERVEKLAAQLRKMDDEKEKEKQRKREEKAKNKPLTTTKELRGKAKTAFDVWDNHPSKAAVSTLLETKQVEVEWVDPALPKPVKLPKGLLERQHPTKLPAVEVAAPGNSYRPAYEDHQDVLGEVLAKRLKRQEEKRKLNKAVRPIQQGLKRKRNNIDEYTAGLEDILGIKKTEGVKEEENGGEEEAEPIHKRNIGSSRWSLKLSKTERNKQKKRELKRKSKKYKRLLKKRKMELEAIPEIAQEVEQEEKEQQEYLERKRAEMADKEGKTKRLSRYAFASQPMPYLLSEEIPQSLRHFKPLADYNPLKERFISLQRRNLIEARVPVVPRRRYRVKYYEPRSAKMEWELQAS